MATAFAVQVVYGICGKIKSSGTIQRGIHRVAQVAIYSHGCYLDAELVVCGSVVKFSACDDGEDVAIVQI